MAESGENSTLPPVTPSVTPQADIAQEDVARLREFFLLLDEWDRAGGLT